LLLLLWLWLWLLLLLLLSSICSCHRRCFMFSMLRIWWFGVSRQASRSCEIRP
jgi:hypothetical protein